MALRTVTGTVVRPDGTFWPEGTAVYFQPKAPVVWASGVRTQTAIEVELDATGNFSIDLEPLPISYTYTLPDNKRFYFVLPEGETSVTVESLILTSYSVPTATNALQALLDAHIAASDPHAGYLTQAEADALYSAAGHSHGSGVEGHEAAGDPHPQYLTQVEGDTFYEPLGTASTLLAAHLAAADPHPSYLTAAEASAAYAALLHANSHHSGGADPLALGSLAGTLTDSQHGSRSGGSLHSTAVAGGAAGFLSGTDKTRIDSAALVNASNVFTTDQRINARLALNTTLTTGASWGFVELEAPNTTQSFFRMKQPASHTGAFFDGRDNSDNMLFTVTSTGNGQFLGGLKVRALRTDSNYLYETQTGNNPNNLFKPRQTGGTALGTQAIASQTGDHYRALDVSGNTLWAVLVGGAMEMAEISTVSAPAADKARLQVRDNGSGKTQFGVMFSDGVFIPLATQA
jgi:hypothetical protein